MKEKFQINNLTVPIGWSIYTFGETFRHLNTFSFSRENLTGESTMSKIQCIHYGDIHTTLENKILDFHNEGYLISFLKDGLIAEELLHTVDFPYLKDGDLIIVDVSEDYIGVCKCIEMKNINEKHIISGLHTIAVRDLKNTTTKGFRTYILMHPQVVRQLRRIATGTSVYSVSKTNLSKVMLPIPPIVEQEKIAKILFCWDKVISTTQTQLIQVQLRNKWLMNQLLSGKRRIKRYVNSEQIHQTILGELPVDWKLNSLKNILSQVKKSFTPLKAELYQQIGIRSHTKGIFYKDKVTGAALGDKRVFWIEANCFIVNIVFAWEHAIAKTTEKEIGMIASHRFPMYKPKVGVLYLDFLLYYFKSLRGKQLLELASPGGAGRNKTLGQSEFMKLQFPVPSLQEQIAIASLLNESEKELKLMNDKLLYLKEQKKGLIKILLTGRKKVT